MYATISAAGKKTKLKMKYKKKLCPLRAATRAGQKAIKTQMMTKMIAPHHQPDIEAMSIRRPPIEGWVGQSACDLTG